MKINIKEGVKKNIERTKWVKWKFSDLVENIVEKVKPKESELKKYIGLKHLDTKSLKIKRFGSTSNLIGEKQKIYKGDLIFAKRNSYLKRIAIVDFDALASAHSMVLRPKSKNVLPEFLPFFLLSETFWQRAIEISVGSLSPTINWKSLANEEFLLPPKNKQTKLAKLFWSINKVIETEKILKEKIEIITKIIARNHLLKLNDNKELKLGEVCKPKQWKTISKNQLTKNGFLVYGGNGIIGHFDEHNHEFPVIAIACRGEYCGNVHLTKPKSYVTGNSMCLDNLDTSRFNIKYLFYYLFYVNLDSVVTGSAQPQIIRDDIERFKIKKISMEKQIDFVNKIDFLWKNIETIEYKINTSKSLQLSLIEQIFNDI